MTRFNPQVLTVFGAGALAAALLACAPSGIAAPESDAAQAMAGTYRLQFDSEFESPRTWTLTAGCDGVTESCVTVAGQGPSTFPAVLSGGRWHFDIPHPTNKTCSAPPVSISTWSWDATTLAGTLVNHIDEGCGQPARDVTVASFTLARL